MRSDDRAKDDVSPSRNYGNRERGPNEPEGSPLTPPAPGTLPAADIETPPEPRDPPDPAQAAPALIETLGHIAAILAAIVAAMPGGHAQAARIDQLRAAVERFVYNASPPAPEK